MIFKFIFRDTIRIREEATASYPLGACIVGLQIRNQRPTSVELSYSELKELLHNTEYANLILKTMYIP